MISYVRFIESMTLFVNKAHNIMKVKKVNWKHTIG